MQISVTEAKGRLTELLRLAEEGGEVILTRHGQPAARLVPVRAARDRLTRKAAIEAIRKSAGKKARPGPDSARSQDFLYGEDGLPK
jgi:prevent-host-death family protein